MFKSPAQLLLEKKLKTELKQPNFSVDLMHTYLKALRQQILLDLKLTKRTTTLDQSVS